MCRALNYLLLFLLAVSCRSNKTDKTPFKEFEFFYSDTWSSAFSIKFTQTDTAYIRQHFVSNRYKKVDSIINDNTSYIGLLDPTQKKTLDSFVLHTKFSQYDSSYDEKPVEDGITMLFFISTDSSYKTIHINSEIAPAELLNFGQWINE
ncbi:MAG TPA: hypothetical protein VK666_22300, partial [Chryseolinea sp.]|nr:hypothetical protein [Chryseolinea sp.]